MRTITSCDHDVKTSSEDLKIQEREVRLTCHDVTCYYKYEKFKIFLGVVGLSNRCLARHFTSQPHLNDF